MGVDRPGVAEVAVAPDLLGQLQPGKQPAGLGGEAGEQRELLRPQGDLDPSHPATEVSRHQPQVAEADLRRRLRPDGFRPGTPDQRLDPHDELVHGEGLGEVVVDTCGKAAELDLLLAPGRQHEDRQVGPRRPELLGDLDAVEVGQHDVEQDEGDVSCPGPLQSRRAVVDHLDLEALAPQVVGHHIGHGEVVFDDEDQRHLPAPAPRFVSLHLTLHVKAPLKAPDSAG